MYVYTDELGNVVAISEKDVLVGDNYVYKFKYDGIIPEEPYLFTFKDGKFLPKPDSQVLPQLKERLKQQLKLIRKKKEKDGIVFVVNNNEYHLSTSLSTRTNLQAVIHSFQSGFLNPEKDRIIWKFDNERYLELDYNILLGIAKCVLDYIEKLFLAEKEHITQIESLTTVEAVKNYNIQDGWPECRYEFPSNG